MAKTDTTRAYLTIGGQVPLKWNSNLRYTDNQDNQVFTLETWINIGSSHNYQTDAYSLFEIESTYALTIPSGTDTVHCSNGSTDHGSFESEFPATY